MSINIKDAKKFKPKKMPLTDKLLSSGEFGWAIMSGIIEGAIILGLAKKGIEYWVCGNPNCGISLLMGEGRVPIACTKCGSEIDWVGIKTRLIKVCPRCNKQGMPYAVYCDSHVPAVKLEDKEVPL